MSGEVHAHDSTDPTELWENWNKMNAEKRSHLLDRRKRVYRDPFGFYHAWMMPLTFFKQWQDVTCATWAWMNGGRMPQMLQHPTRSGLPSMVSLEERVFAIEDAFVNVENGYLKAATDQMMGGLTKPLEQIDVKLDTLNTHSSIVQKAEMPGNLAERLERIEDKLNTLLNALEKIEGKVPLESAKSDGEDETLYNLKK